MSTSRGELTINRILVTGGAGFIGSHFIEMLLRKDKDAEVLCLDALTYSGSLGNMSSFLNDPRFTFIHGNICDRPLVRQIFREYSVDTVINFAAETHVDNSIKDPEKFLLSNVIGTSVLLDSCVEHWTGQQNPEQDFRFIQISTDEVYGATEITAGEGANIKPGNPYSASKAAADLLCLSYVNTYALPVIITRCTNNYGPRQHKEKLIPKTVYNAKRGEPVTLYGSGCQSRNWIYVTDHCRAVLGVIKKGVPGEIYNISGSMEMENLTLAKKILDIIGASHQLIEMVSDRPGHDKCYRIDRSKLKLLIGEYERMNFNEGLRLTVKSMT